MNLQQLQKLISDFNSYTKNTYSHLRQDILTVLLYNYKTNGYFVEFGALDGKKDSNTYLLEKEYGWTGILAEPGKIFHNDLKLNRSCIVDTRAVTNKTGDFLDFKETHAHLGLSGIVEHVYNCNDEHVSLRKASEGNIYKVETVSLNDLLSTHNAPFEIDYMSVDTEGSETLILEAFDFSKHQIGLISVEHNYVEKHRQKVKDILFPLGYKRIMHEFSKCDDWFILDKLF
jgi:hypothetical protein